MKGDEVWFSEVSPRPHDTGLVTLVSQYQSEFALHARAILGLPVSTEMKSPGASAVIYGGMDAEASPSKAWTRRLRVPESELRLFGKPESFVKRRMGVALARGRDTNEARGRAKTAAALIKTGEELRHARSPTKRSPKSGTAVTPWSRISSTRNR